MDTLTMPTRTLSDLADDVLHTVCCHPDIAFCGADVSREPWSSSGTPCPLCEHMQAEALPCPVRPCLGGAS